MRRGASRLFWLIAEKSISNGNRSERKKDYKIFKA